MVLTFYLFVLGRMACGILVPGPGIEPWSSTVKAPSLNHWVAKEFPILVFKLFRSRPNQEFKLPFDFNEVASL